MHQLRLLTAGIALLAPLASAGAAWAHEDGIVADGCDGCHTGGQPPTVTLTASPTDPAVGQAVTLTVTVSQTNGPVAGFYLTTEPLVGTFVATEAGTAASALGVTHTMPRTGSGGVTTFQAEWSASVPTVAEFWVYALSANGDGTPQGDAGGAATLPIAAGCVGMNYILDEDGDGYGTSDPAYEPVLACSKPEGYVLVGGDCNDLDPTIHPGAVEVCDGKDNNCDGRIDEGLPTTVYCEDQDGDGHGVPGEATMVGCKPSPGFGDCGGDCNDHDPTSYPGAPELCDGIDNNCNGEIDDGALAMCGVGLCRRSAATCTALCTPGYPQPEICDALDDDCDGVVDNGTNLQLCGAADLKCVGGECVPATADAGAARGPDASRDGSAGPPAVPPDGGSGGTGPGPASASRTPGGCDLGRRAPGSDEFGFVTALVALVAILRRRNLSRQIAPRSPLKSRARSVSPEVRNLSPPCAADGASSVCRPRQAW